MDNKESMNAIAQFVCFKLANEEYAVDTNCVQEVIRFHPITPLPQVPDFILGLVNIRGNVVVIFDLCRKLKLPRKPIDENSRMILIQIGGVLSCFLVDEIIDNIKIDGTKIDPSLNVRMSIPKECVRGLGMVDERIIAIIDHEKLNKSMVDEINVSLIGVQK